MAAQAGLIGDMLAEPNTYEPRFQCRRMACIATLSSKRVHGRQWTTRIWFGIPLDCIANEPNNCDSGKCSHESRAEQSPPSPLLEVVEVVALSEALGCAFARHDFSSVP
jgi:hypothetical protein